MDGVRRRRAGLVSDAGGAPHHRGHRRGPGQPPGRPRLAPARRATLPSGAENAVSRLGDDAAGRRHGGRAAGHPVLSPARRSHRPGIGRPPALLSPPVAAVANRAAHSDCRDAARRAVGRDARAAGGRDALARPRGALRLRGAAGVVADPGGRRRRHRAARHWPLPVLGLLLSTGACALAALVGSRDLGSGYRRATVAARISRSSWRS